MKNYDYEESNMCKFNNCKYYDYDTQKCCLRICKNLKNKDNKILYG